MNLSQQVVEHDADLALEKPHPFAASDEKAASVGYVYRRYHLDEGEVVVVRAEIDAYKEKAGKPAYMLVKALNEYDVKVTGAGGWRAKLESQRAGTFATEVRNNSCKLARWALQAHLAGAEAIKLGWVSRATMRDPYSHVILGMEEHSVADFMREISLDLGQMWGIAKALLSQLHALEDGTYLLLRDPAKRQLVIYKVADGEFDT